MRALRAVPAAALLLTACTAAHARTSAHFTEGGVDVTITVTATTATAVFRPVRRGFHLYSRDLPPGGVQGLGVPTKLAVRAGLAAAGRPGADRPVRNLRLPDAGVTVPVYPDGPVTFTLPVRRTGHSGEAVVSYGTCSATTCMAPVTDHVTRFTY